MIILHIKHAVSGSFNLEEQPLSFQNSNNFGHDELEERKAQRVSAYEADPITLNDCVKSKNYEPPEEGNSRKKRFSGDRESYEFQGARCEIVGRMCQQVNACGRLFSIS